MKNVVITGNIRCGKSHTAKILVDNGYELYKFATPIKKITAELTGLTLEGLELNKHNPLVIEGTTIDNAIKVVHMLLMMTGVSEFGADERIGSPEVVLMPNPMFGGMSTESMIYEVDDLLRKCNEHDYTIRTFLQLLGTDLIRNWNEDIHVELAREAVKSTRKNLVFDDARFENELEFCRKELNASVYWLHRPILTQEDFHESECSISNEDADQTILSQEGELLTQAAQAFFDRGSWPEEVVMA